MASDAKKRVLILGGGFAGVYAALEFERDLARDPNVEVTLVSEENFFLFTPMLHEVAASDLDITHIVSPIRKLLQRVQFFHGNVEAVDLGRRIVAVSHSTERHHHDLEYDHLIIALGTTTNFFGLPGLEQRALTMKSLGDAILLRNLLIERLEEADFECAVSQREHLLTVVVAGGGFAGVETIAGVNDFLRESLCYYPHLTEGHLRVVLVHPGEVILPELGEELGRYAQKELARRGVDIRTGARVVAVTDDHVELKDGTKIPTRLLVWTAGTTPNPLLNVLPCAKERGRIVVKQTLEVAGWPGVWALGDCAQVPDKNGKPYPPTAQHAIREARVAARNVTAAIRGGQQQPFVFNVLGQLAAIGRRTGVAKVFGVRFSGFFAWFLWRTIYLMKLPRFEKKLRVAIDWTLDLLFAKDLVQFHTGRAATLSRAEAEGHLATKPVAAPGLPAPAAHQVATSAG